MHHESGLAERPRGRATGRAATPLRQRMIIAFTLGIVAWMLLRRAAPSVSAAPSLAAPGAPPLSEHNSPRVDENVVAAAPEVVLNSPELPEPSTSEAVPPTPSAAAGSEKSLSGTPPVVSIYSAYLDRFVRVDEDGGLHTDVEYPWSERSWFTVLRLASNLSIASPLDGWPSQAASGRQLAEQAAPAATVLLQTGRPRAGRVDAELAEGGATTATGSIDEAGVDASADGPEAERAEAAYEMWRGEELAGEWFVLASVKHGRLLQLHSGDDGDNAWVALADVPPPTARQLTLAAATAGSSADAGADAGGRHRAAARKAGGRKGPWTAPPGACWQLKGDRLLNRGTGGVLNVRPGGNLRGHGNRGPPWRTDEGLDGDESSILALRAVPRQLREAGGRGGRRGGVAIRPRQYSFLSVDYHIATAQDVGHTLRELGQLFVEKSLSGACQRRRTCAQPHELPIITREGGFTLCPRPHATRRAAYEALRTSPMLTSADGVVCSHPAALCEVWLPFNKSILLIVTANLELARENHERWRAWLETVVAFSKAPRVVVAANNRYDQAYVEHFTGVRPLYLPTLANYITARYRPLPNKPILLARSHHALGKKLLTDLRRAARAHPGLRVSSIEEYYPGNAAGGGYEYTQLASHPAIVVVPYTKSTMTFFELCACPPLPVPATARARPCPRTSLSAHAPVRAPPCAHVPARPLRIGFARGAHTDRIGIPIFVPSLELLVRWELQRHVMSERVYWKHAPSPLLRAATPNPNSLQDQKALDHWIKLSDPYVYPHVQYFDSAEDLAAKLATTNMREVGAKMRRHTAEMQPVMRQKWRAVLRKLFHGRPSGSWPCGDAGGFDAALKSRFGLSLSSQEPDCARLSAPDQGQWN